MANKLPMARKEIERWTMLLDRESDREASGISSSRDERKKSSTTFRGDPSSSVKDTKRQGKGSRKAEGVDASSSKPKGHRRDNKDRKSDRRAKGEDTTVWRSASELGITFPDSFCSGSTAHYRIEVERVDSGSVFRCIHCHKHKWLPTNWIDAESLGVMIWKHGSTDGYRQYLDEPRNRQAKILIAKLQELERLSATITDASEMAKIAVRILGQKNYDRRQTSG